MKKSGEVKTESEPVHIILKHRQLTSCYTLLTPTLLLDIVPSYTLFTLFGE